MTQDMEDLLERARTELLPKMEASAMTLALFDGRVQPAFALEIGVAVLMDKPILGIVLKGAPVPSNLRRAAHSIIEIDTIDSPEGQQRVRDAILKLAKEITGKPYG